MVLSFGTEGRQAIQARRKHLFITNSRQEADSSRQESFYLESEVMKRKSVFVGVLIVLLTLLLVGSGIGQSGLTEAPAGFDAHTNGFTSQEQYDLDKKVFIEQDGIDEGLGPLYNAQSCGECHQNPVTGGISQVTELRAGFFNGFAFIDQPGGSLVNDRAIDPAIQERVL